MCVFGNCHCEMKVLFNFDVNLVNVGMYIVLLALDVMMIEWSFIFIGFYC